MHSRERANKHYFFTGNDLHEFITTRGTLKTYETIKFFGENCCLDNSHNQRLKLIGTPQLQVVIIR